MEQVPMNLSQAATRHAKRIVETLGDELNAKDVDAVCIYGMLMESLENLPEMEMTDRDRASLQLKTVLTLNSVRRSLALTKDEQRKQASGGKIGRPPKNSQWDDVEV